MVDKPDGRNITVTEENKHEYVRLVAMNKLTESIKDQIQAFQKGFYEIIPRDVISIFDEQVKPAYQIKEIAESNSLIGIGNDHLWSAIGRRRRPACTYSVRRIHGWFATDPVVLARSSLIQSGATHEAHSIRDGHRAHSSRRL